MTGASHMRGASTRTTSRVAYREFERRYYAGEGAAYAESGDTMTDLVIAESRGEFDKIFDELSVPELHFEQPEPLRFPGSLSPKSSRQP